MATHTTGQIRVVLSQNPVRLPIFPVCLLSRKKKSIPSLRMAGSISVSNFPVSKFLNTVSKNVPIGEATWHGCNYKDTKQQDGAETGASSASAKWCGPLAFQPGSALMRKSSYRVIQWLHPRHSLERWKQYPHTNWYIKYQNSIIRIGSQMELTQCPSANEQMDKMECIPIMETI